MTLQFRILSLTALLVVAVVDVAAVTPLETCLEVTEFRFLV